MPSHLNLWRPLVLAAVLASAGTAQATITVYTTQSSFLAAVLNPGVDTFAGFDTTDITTGPITRSAGTYGYNASVVSSQSFYGSGTAGDPALSTNSPSETILINGFTGSVTALGANLYDTDINGAYAVGDLTVTATDASGTVTYSVTSPTVSSFVGFVSDGLLTSFSVAATQPAVGDLWPTVDNLTLAVNPVPEPAAVALMLAGLALVVGAARKRG